MSIAMYAPQIETAPAPYASPTLQLVVDNTRPKKPLSPHEVDLKRRTADMHVLQFKAEQMISRKDQIRVMDVLKKYAQVILSVLFRGSIIHYAVNLQQIDEQEHRDYLTNIERDIAEALLSHVDTGRELTRQQRQEIETVLSRWHRHVIRRVLFCGEVVRYAVDLSNIALEHHESVHRAIQGDIFVAARNRNGEWN